MTLVEILNTCGLEHVPCEGNPAARSLKCPQCGKGAADVSLALDDTHDVCLTCPRCKPSGTTRFTPHEFRQRFGNGQAAAFDPGAGGLPGTWADLDALVGPVQWEWKGWLPRGFLVLVVAGVGVGKSNLALALARSYLLGEPFPDGSPLADLEGSICWAETECGQALNLDRAKKWGLPLDRILTPLADPMADVVLTDPSHITALRQVASDPDVRLVIVDSLSGGNRIDENSAAMGRVVQSLAGIARDTEKPVLGVHHVRKRKDTDPDPRFGISIDQIRGHSSIVQSPRVIWGLDQPGGPNADARRLHVIKNNLRAFPEPVGMVVADDGTVTFGDAPEEPEMASACSDAMDWLRRLLDREPLPASEVLEEAAKAKIATRTLYRAKGRLRVSSPKVEGVWFWSLPAPGGYDLEGVSE